MSLRCCFNAFLNFKRCSDCASEVTRRLRRRATLGGLGLWMLYDLILLLTGQFRDADDKRVIEPV
jgi:hypothetical protein